MSLLVLSVVFYQLSQKIIPTKLNPWHVLFFAYIIAGVISFLMGILNQGEDSLFTSFKNINVGVIGLGLSIIGIELGFLLAMRAGWPLSLTGLTSNVTVAVLLIPVGLLVFKEHLNLAKGIGIILCILGLILVARK